VNQERLLQVILSPHVTNKAYEASDRTSYVVFKVATNSTKLEIRKAVESLFEVKVDTVNTVKVKGKARRFGRIEGRTKDWKKAYVKLQQGHNINFISAE
jgi:large subunit ribosomal protein L23